jgi:hypothetical protein
MLQMKNGFFAKDEMLMMACKIIVDWRMFGLTPGARCWPHFWRPTWRILWWKRSTRRQGWSQRAQHVEKNFVNIPNPFQWPGLLILNINLLNVKWGPFIFMVSMDVKEILKATPIKTFC